MMLLGYKRGESKYIGYMKYAIPARFFEPAIQNSTRIVYVPLLKILSSVGTELTDPSTSRSYCNALNQLFHLIACQKIPVTLQIVCLSACEDRASGETPSKLYPRSTTAPNWSTELTSSDKNEVQLGSVALLHHALPLRSFALLSRVSRRFLVVPRSVCFLYRSSLFCSLII